MLAKAVNPYHFKVFFSGKYLHAFILDKLRSTHVASVSSNNRIFALKLGAYVPKAGLEACELAGKLLASKAAHKQVNQLYWDGEIHQKTTRKNRRPNAEKLWETLRANSQIRLLRKIEQEPGVEEREVQPYGPMQPLAKKGKGIDPAFREEMWRIMQERKLRARDAKRRELSGPPLRPFCEGEGEQEESNEQA